MVDHVDTDLSIPTLLRSRRPFFCSGNQHHAGERVRSSGHESESTARRARSGLHVLKLILISRMGNDFGRKAMQDILWIVVTIAFFALSIGYVRFCDRVK